MLRATDLRFELADGRPAPERLFADVDLSEIQTTEVRQLEIRNHHDTITLRDAHLWVEAVDGHPVTLSVDAETFWPASSEVLSIGLGDIGPGDSRRFWVRRDPVDEEDPTSVRLMVAGTVET